MGVGVQLLFAFLLVAQLSKLTVEDLKVYLRATGLPLSGKKGELVERILSHIES